MKEPKVCNLCGTPEGEINPYGTISKLSGRHAACGACRHRKNIGLPIIKRGQEPQQEIPKIEVSPIVQEHAETKPITLPTAPTSPEKRPRGRPIAKRGDKEQYTQISAYVKRSIYREARSLLYLEGKELSELVEEALINYVNSRTRK